MINCIDVPVVRGSTPLTMTKSDSKREKKRDSKRKKKSDKKRVRYSFPTSNTDQ